MDEIRMRRCGQSWSYCDGQCDTCMTSYHRSTNRTEEQQMDNYTATEQAYKNGYEQGLKDAVKHGRWEKHPAAVLSWQSICSECKEDKYWEINYVEYEEWREKLEEDDKDDKELWYSTEVYEQELRQILGEYYEDKETRYGLKERR